MTTLLIVLAALSVAASLFLWRQSSTLRRELSIAREEKDVAVRESDAVRNKAALEAALHSSEIASLNSRIGEADTRRLSVEAELVETRAQLADSREETARLSTSLAHIEEEREERERMLETRFQNLANDILRRNSADFKAQNEERLNELLSPLKTDLDEFRKTITDTYSTEARERFSLTERIRELVELNNTISREARELSSALKGNTKVQGDWGEMVLESILEKSGLVKDEEYFVQATTDEAGNAITGEGGGKLRPDVVVKYPDGRYVVIDSKVSLTAFIEYVNADDDNVRKDAASRHIRSVKNHVDKLSRKSYHTHVGSEDGKLDFVMMFIPNEPAYIAAMRLDPALWQDAYDRKVLIVSPTHLVSGLRLIAQLWSRDKVTRNAIKIAEEAGKMYDKFADFTNDMERIDKALASARKAHEDAVRKLSSGTGNLVKRARDLHALGIKAQKQLAASMESDENE